MLAAGVFVLCGGLVLLKLLQRLAEDLRDRAENRISARPSSRPALRRMKSRSSMPRSVAQAGMTLEPTADTLT